MNATRKINPHEPTFGNRDDLLNWLNGSHLVGSRSAVDRLRRAGSAQFLGVNLLGDEVYCLGRLPRERAAKRLYVSSFARRTAAGALARITVAAAP